MNRLKRHLGFLFAMLLTAGAAYALTPRHKIAEHNPMPKLEEVIPNQFGQWQAVQGSNHIIDPGQKNLLSRLYEQLLTRTYANAQGYRIMLSIAYGGNQRDELELHKPEVCYVAQGFVLLQKQRAILPIADKPTPLTQLITRMGNRNEPVTYWATIGDTVINNGYAKKWVELKYGLMGQIPDGVLIRVSAIDENNHSSLQLQQEFLSGLMSALEPKVRGKFLGGAP